MDGSVSRPSSGRSPNKYASFSPSRKVEDNTKVDTVQIKFLDPSSQKLSSKEVFVDPDTWSRKASEMRFLISADLVNLVAESFAARSARFAKAKKRLEQSRLCFLVDLWKLRGLVDRVSRCVAEGCQACPIQFFVPELYFDEHTLEQLRQASDVFFEHLLVEMSQLQERLDLLGGKNWRNLLQYSLKFMSTTEVGSMLMDAIPDPKTRKTVENAITRGLWDQMAELQPVLEELEEAMEDYNARYDWVQEDIAQKLAQIARCGERQQVAEEKFEEAVPEVPEDSSSEIEPENEAEDEEESVQDDNSSAASSADDWDEEEEVRKFILLKGVPPSKAQLKKMRRTQAREQKMTKMKEQKASKEEGIQQKSRARIRSLLARWEKSVASVKEEVKVLEQPLQDAQQQSADTMDEDYVKAKEEAKALEAKAAKLQEETQQATQKALEVTQQVAIEEEKIQSERKEVQELKKEVQSLPPPDPRVGMMRQLGEEQVELMKKSKIVKERITVIQGRKKMLKMELRELYRILNWDWEDSSSEEEEGDKPYWLRKKLAQSTASDDMPFNGSHFLNDEKAALERRLQKRKKVEKLRAAARLLAMLQAKRCAVPDPTPSPPSHSPERTDTSLPIATDSSKTMEIKTATWESNVLPFKQDLPGESVSPVRKEAVRWKERPKSVRLKEALEKQLQTARGELPRLEMPRFERRLELDVAGQSDYRDFEARDQSARQQSRRSSLDSPSERLPARRRAQNRTTAGGTRPEVDFGFRPDGAGEESVESWSLFKVNKAPPEPDRTQKKGLVRNPRNADTNFGEYMSQLQQSSQEMWHSTSAPELPKNRVLPDLTKNHSQQALTQLNWTNRRWKASRR